MKIAFYGLGLIALLLGIIADAWLVAMMVDQISG